MNSMITKEDIVELYLSENSLSLRYWGVASRLKSNPNETLKMMGELLDKGVLYRQSGYHQLNPPHLWKDQQLIKKYGKRAEKMIVNSAREFLLSFEKLVKEWIKTLT